MTSHNVMDGHKVHGSCLTLFQVMACCLAAPSHYLKQSWLIIIRPLRNFSIKFQLRLQKIIPENAFENAVCRMAAILFRPQHVNLPVLDTGIFPANKANDMAADTLAHVTPNHQQPWTMQYKQFLVFQKEGFQLSVSFQCIKKIFANISSCFLK